MIGCGAHRPLTGRELKLKLGSAAQRAGSVSSHDAYESEVDYFGVSKLGTPVLINRIVAQAEFSVAVSGIYPLAVTAFGGGAKMVMPGVSHISSICWNHERLSTGVRAGSVMGAQRRQDIEEIARMFGLDAGACAVINSRREVAGLFVGEAIKAHRRGVAFARRVHRTDFDDGADYDLTIANAYPLDADPHQLCKSQWVLKRFDEPALILSALSDPIRYHGQGDGPWREFRKSAPRKHLFRQASRELMEAERILYTPAYGRTFFPSHRGWYCENNWSRLMRKLQERFPKARVRVVPTAPIQY